MVLNGNLHNMRLQDKKRILYVDTDSAEQDMPNGACRSILNSRTLSTINGAKGVSENVRQNLLVPNENLPAGTNTCIGTFPDNTSNTIIYFYHNSANFHSIFRYYPGENDRIDTILISSVLNFSKDYLITSVDLVDDLLYWTDNYNPPRKINLSKANNTGKNFINNVYFPNALLNNAITYTVNVADANGSIASETLTGSSQDNLEAISKDFARQVNINTVLCGFLTADSCGTSTALTTKIIESNLTITVTATVGETTYTLRVIADNYYPDPFLDEFIQRVKYPLDCEPDVVYKKDTTQKLNLVQNKVFQFRTQVVYDDYEKSVWSAISIVATSPTANTKTSTNDPYNYIEVNYDTSVLNDSGDLSIIRAINIAVREGNLGLFKFVTQLSKAQAISNNNIYKFYNDGIYSTIDAAESNKQYDAVGLLVQAQEFANNRIFDGGITEGYDNVCIDSELSINYRSEETFHNINGIVFIRNPFAGSQKINIGGNGQTYMAHQPIHIDQSVSTNPIVFGGFDYNSVIDSNGSAYNQRLPLGGFVFYLAGTPYRGVSKQYYVGPLFTGAKQNQNSGIYTSGTGGDGTPALRDSIREIMEEHNVQGLPGRISDTYGATHVYSTFQISNVPKGKYVMRIASHLTTQQQLDDKRLPYQKTSTNALSVGGVIGTECELEILENGDIVIDGITYPKDTNIGSSAVADLTDPTLFYNSAAVSGYVCDKDTPTYTGLDILKDTRIELARVDLTNGNQNRTYNAIVAAYGLSWLSQRAYTDHNGYVFYAASSNHLPTSGFVVNISQITSGIYALTPSKITLNSTVTATGGAFSGAAAGSGRSGIFRNTNNDVQAYSRTKINGSTIYQQLGLPDISVIISKGGVGETDANGAYSLYAYVNTKLSPTQSTRNDRIYYLLLTGDAGSIVPNPDEFNIEISALGAPQTVFTSPYSGKYNAANELQTIQVQFSDISNGAANQSLKRGGKYKMGIVYFDAADRKTFVATNNELNLNIPFYTEKELPTDTNVIGQGQPIVSWDIKSLPPNWATHYQWVRTINGNQGRYLQWTANLITYRTDTEALSDYINGTKVYINLENITTFKTANKDSKVSYQFEEGDRLVFIKDPQGNFFNDYYDFKITGSYGINEGVVIDNLVSLGNIQAGTLFEIYNPLKTSDVNIFYEMGECYPVTENNSGIKIHQGPTINQEYWNFASNFDDNGKLAFIGTEEHDFQIGDTIFITQDAGFENANYEGEKTILTVTATTITTDSPFLAVTSTNQGNAIRYAAGTFTTGDTWNRSRSIPFKAGSVDKTTTWQIEDASISDFYDSKAQSIGRPNVINKESGRLYRPSTIRFSNSYIQGTKINGLSGFEALNEKELPFQYGLINRLCFSRDVIVAIFGNSEIVSMYLGKSVLKDLGATQLVAISDKIISDSYEYQGSLGSQHPECIDMDDDGNIFGFDSNKGVVWKRVANGLVPISEFDNRTYFKNKSESIGATTWPVRVYGIHDRLFDQYIITFDFIRGNPEFTGLKIVPVGDQQEDMVPMEITDFPIYDNTFGFNAKENKWESFYTYFPEFYGKARNNVFVSFFNGQLYKHNVNILYNNFYGVQLPQRAKVIGNSDPSTMKRYMNMSLETNKPWSAPSINTPSGQESELVESDFELIENVYHADLLKDANTPNVENPLIFGEDLLGETVEVEIENSNSEYTKIYAINIYSITSEPTNK